jgi:hypothetical protein
MRNTNTTQGGKSLLNEHELRKKMKFDTNAVMPQRERAMWNYD